MPDGGYARSVRVERVIVLPCPVEEAWEMLVDWERQADWMLDADSVRVMSAEREGVGVRLAVRTRLFGIPAFTEPMQVIAWEPPGRLMIRHGGVVEGTGIWTLSPQDGSARFTWTEEVALRVPVLGELAARVYRPLLQLLMDRAMQGLRRAVISRGPRRSST
jgi:carbon monoxide dehydrogenase subunit G